MDHLRVAEDGAVGSPSWVCHARPASRFIGFVRQRPEIIFFVVLILIFNTPLLFGHAWQSMIFQPEAVRSGQWWRLFTHPFVHLTWYHLLLDGTAFLSLYCSLVERKTFVRLPYVFATAGGSLVTSWIASPIISTNGLCGLSGIAHGLMAISAIEMLGGDRTERRIGWVTFILVLGKGAFEAITGKMFFGFLDFGLLGNPVAVSHAGGILGALIAMLLLRWVEQARALFFVLPALLVFGCSSTNVSNREPLADYVGRTVTLNRSMALIKEGRGMMAWSHLPRLRKSPYVMLDIDASEKGFLHLYPTDTNVIVLPVGHTVTIDTVHDEIAGIDPVHTTAYGRVILPGTHTSVRFAFAWGDTVRLFPAPWEPDNVPNRRYRIGWEPIPLYNPELRAVPEADIPRWGRKVPGV